MRRFIVTVRALTSSKKEERATYKIRTGGGPVEAKRMAIGEFFAYELAHKNRYMKLEKIDIREVENDS